MRRPEKNNGANDFLFQKTWKITHPLIKSYVGGLLRALSSPGG
jgi:hypothetical protein